MSRWLILTHDIKKILMRKLKQKLMIRINFFYNQAFEISPSAGIPALQKFWLNMDYFAT